MLRSLASRFFGASPGSPERSGAYEMLPTSADAQHSYRRKTNGNPIARFCTKRIIRLIAITSVCLLAVHFFLPLDLLGEAEGPNRKPPLYTDYYLKELELPQHNLSLPFPEGGHGQYLWNANHQRGVGWGNVMQEHLLNAHLAHGSGRGFVYDNYTWNRDGSDYTDYNGHLIPSRIPMSALIRSPAAGGSWPPGDPTPRAVAKEYWDAVCPEPHVMRSDELYQEDAPVDAGEMLRAWVEKLKTLPRCVEIREGSPQIWNVWVFGGKRVLGLWDSLKRSPIITQFRWSALVENGVTRNWHLFADSSWLRNLFFPPPAYPYDVVPGLLAIHIRRGDFVDHCMHFARHASEWNGFNQFPELPEKFVPPQGSGGGEYTEEAKEVYLKHCYPDIAQIVQRVREVRATPAGRGLKRAYIMTNGKRPWVAELKEELAKLGGWDRISSSRDLKLNWEQRFVAQSVDMLIGQRAQVIIGNGFSSLTSNVVMLRMARGVPADSNRFL